MKGPGANNFNKPLCTCPTNLTQPKQPRHPGQLDFWSVSVLLAFAVMSTVAKISIPLAGE